MKTLALPLPPQRGRGTAVAVEGATVASLMKTLAELANEDVRFAH